MKIAIVGVGGMGEVHFNIYKDMTDIEFVAACDIRFEMLQKKAEGVNIRLYADYEEMLEKEKPDIVDICTPTYMHKDHAITALKHGANVISEKPMAIHAADGDEIIKTAKECGKLYMVAHVVRFMAAYRYLAQAIESKRMGKTIKLHMKRISSTPRWSNENWMLDKDKSGLVTLDLMIHDVDFMQYMFGKPKDIVGAYYDMRDLSNYLSACYIYDDLSVSIETGWLKADYPFVAEYLAFFEDGYIEFKGGKLYENREEIDLNNSDTARTTGINISSADGYFEELRYFIDCVRNNRAPEKVTPESSRYSVELIEETIEKAHRVN